MGFARTITATVALALAVATVAAATEEGRDKGTLSRFCNALFDVFDRVNGPLADEAELSERIHTLDRLFAQEGEEATAGNQGSYSVDECWFSYKVRANYAHMLQLDGRVQQAIAQNRRAVSLAMNYNPKDVLTPAFNLATSLQAWSFGEPTLVAEADRTWRMLSSMLSDRSLRIRAATHLPNMLPSASLLRDALARLRLNLQELESEKLDCEYFQKCSSENPPQNISDWYPTYPLHYHLMDASDTMRIAAAVSRLYWRAAKGISWVAPPQFISAIGRGEIS